MRTVAILPTRPLPVKYHNNHFKDKQLPFPDKIAYFQANIQEGACHFASPAVHFLPME
jgi:hypothetical protein